MLNCGQYYKLFTAVIMPLEACLSMILTELCRQQRNYGPKKFITLAMGPRSCYPMCFYLQSLTAEKPSLLQHAFSQGSIILSRFWSSSKFYENLCSQLKPEPSRLMCFNSRKNSLLNHVYNSDCIILHKILHHGLNSRVVSWSYPYIRLSWKGLPGTNALACYKNL